MTNKPILHNEDDSETELPVKWEICGHCAGHGTSSAYLGAFTREQLEDQGPEFIEDYIGGRYDRACDRCGGSGKVATADISKMSKADIARYRQQEREEQDCREIERRERLMEGGWREEGWSE